jgi:hypothetical protein
MRFSCRTDHDREAGRRIFESVNFVAASPDA